MKSSPQPAKKPAIAYPEKQINPTILYTAAASQLPRGPVKGAGKGPVPIAKQKKKKK